MMVSSFYNQSRDKIAKIAGYALIVVIGVLLSCGLGIDLDNSCGISGNDVLTQINVNTAEPSALTLLPGIGDKLAQRIVDYRKNYDSHGLAFIKSSDLEKVKGIGPKKANEISNYICFE